MTLLDPEVAVPAGVGPEAPGLPRVLDAFAEVIEAIDSDATLDEILHLIARKISALVGCSRCSVYLKHSDSGLYRGQVIESSSGNTDVDVQQLTCGIQADRITQEMLATRGPVLVRNAQSDPRAVRSIMRRFGVRSILGVPMIVRDDVVGLFYLDDEEQPHPFTDEHQAVAQTFAQLAGVAILQAQRSAETRANLKTIGRQNELLRRSTAIEERLTRLVLEGGTLADIAAATAELTGKPCVVHDASFCRLAAAGDGGDGAMVTALDAEIRSLPSVRDALDGITPMRPALVGPLPAAGLARRSLLLQVVLHDEAWGYLTLLESGARFTALDAAVARRAGTAIAIALAVEQRSRVARRHARQALIGDLVNGLEDLTALERQAELGGFAIRAPHVVALLAARPGCARPETTAVERAWAAVADGPLWAAPVPNGVAIALELDAAIAPARAVGSVKELVGRLCAELGGVIAAISTVCREPADYAAAYGEARQVLRSLATLRDENGRAPIVVSADELGAGLLMITTVERDEADRFVRATLGPLLDGTSRTLEELLVTVRVFIEQSRSVRNAARCLSVHENTIRYRLGRIHELIGLDVATDCEAQLSVQIAMLILRLQGRLPEIGAAAASPAAASA